MRGIYPPIMPGEEMINVLRGLWYDDADELWIWLDRVHHRLYGSDLLDKIGFFSAGVRLRIAWNVDGLACVRRDMIRKCSKKRHRRNFLYPQSTVLNRLAKRI